MKAHDPIVGGAPGPDMAPRADATWFEEGPSLPVLDELGIGLDPHLFELALTHRSFAYENGGLPTNERLEFLGDSVLGIVITEALYRQFPDHSEGELAKLRAAVVNSRALARVARSLGLGPMMRLGKGELATGGRDKASILADTMEAVIGATYLTGNLDSAKRFIHHLFDPLLDEATRLGAGLDWKTSLQELASSLGLGVPLYEITGTGPDHNRRFEAHVLFGDLRFGPGGGRNKKQAEQQAAALAFGALEASHRDDEAPEGSTGGPDEVSPDASADGPPPTS